MLKNDRYRITKYIQKLSSFNFFDDIGKLVDFFGQQLGGEIQYMIKLQKV